MTNEERIVELEIKVARQDDLMDELNKTVYAQQKKIDELETLCSALARHVKDLRETASETTGGVSALERPPHY
jgi:SlyX protein